MYSLIKGYWVLCCKALEMAFVEFHGFRVRGVRSFVVCRGLGLGVRAFSSRR